MKEPEYVAQTLAWCNERRKEKGKEPLDRLPKGIRYDSHSCPCGKATGLSVGAGRWGERYDHCEYKSHSTPLPVGEFVIAFDAGLLPQYIAK